jgi:hypothetical protein
MDTYLRRKIYGDKSWVAKTGETFELNGRQAQLLVTTSKNDRGQLTTSACIGFINDTGGVTTAIFSDYFKWLERTTTRCTEKAVSAQQARNVANWAQLKADVFAFYAAKAAA